MAAQKFGITTRKKDNFSEWYQEVVVRGELLDYYDIRGCFIMRPASMFMWSQIRKFFDQEIEKLGVRECYFPMLIPKKNLELEKEHLANFDPELAWITRCGSKTLDEPVAIRPTSETVMYPSFANWLKTYRDLPLKLNQWCSVLRWEVKSTLPFIRGREFLWQEGHTAFYDKPSAEEETRQILDIYARVYEDLLAVPVTKGRKSKNETFGGADYTLTTEAFIPATGKGVQGATSHHLGQNFAKMFNILVETDVESAERQLVYQNSWGLTTRSIGIAVMLHSDDNGFVCPPRIAEIQVVVVMCGIKATTTEEEKTQLREYAEGVVNKLRGNVRVHFDERENVSPGFKFNHWEIRGVPLRIEVGFRDMENGVVCAVRRDDRSKNELAFGSVVDGVREMLEQMHVDMFNKAKKEIDNCTAFADDFSDFIKKLNEGCRVHVPWCGKTECEKQITEKTTVRDGGEVITQGAKSLCMPFDSKKCFNEACINCGDEAVAVTIFGRSY